MVPTPRFERGTYRLQSDCTTVVLCRHISMVVALGVEPSSSALQADAK